VGYVQDDQYELMPSSELDYLRKEVEKLKRNPLGDTQASITLLDSINKLNANIARLNDIFAGANDDMVKAFSDVNLQDQIRKMQEQQEKLARGIVAVGEMVRKVEESRQAPLPSLDQFVPEKPVPVQQSFTQDLPPASQQRNPFDDGGRNFAPLLNEPLPRPLGSGPLPPLPQSMRPIPDSDIPLPPRRQ
jgi:hypothetical protein